MNTPSHKSTITPTTSEPLSPSVPPLQSLNATPPLPDPQGSSEDLTESDGSFKDSTEDDDPHPALFDTLERYMNNLVIENSQSEAALHSEIRKLQTQLKELQSTYDSLKSSSQEVQRKKSDEEEKESFETKQTVDSLRHKITELEREKAVAESARVKLVEEKGGMEQEMEQREEKWRKEKITMQERIESLEKERAQWEKDQVGRG